MPLRPGESFLEGSARVKRQRAGRAAIASFVPVKPPPKKSATAKADKDVANWEKLTPIQKVQRVGFANVKDADTAAIRYRYLREAERTQAAREAQGRLEAKDPTLVRRDRYREQTARQISQKLKSVPKAGRENARQMLELQAHLADPDRERTFDTIAGIAEVVGPDFGRYLINRGLRPAAPPPGRTTVTPMGYVPLGITQDVEGILQNIGLGTAAGVTGLTSRKNLSADIREQVSGAAQLASLVTNPSRTRARQFAEQAEAGFLGQYGPDTPMSEVWRLSKERPISSIATGVGTAAAIAKPLSLVGAFGRVTPEAAAASRLGYLGAAIRESRYPSAGRTLTLRGGPQGMGVDVEIPWARSPIFRPIQRSYDALSRRLGPGSRFSESRRAARQVKKVEDRNLRRAQAEVFNAAKEAGDPESAEALRAFYTRGKPADVSDEDWLKAMIADTEAMIAGRDVITPQGVDPKLVRLRANVMRLERKYDRAKAGLELDKIPERKLRDLVAEERSLKAKIRSAQTRKRPTDELAEQLANVQDQLAVARGHDVRPVPDNPGRRQMHEVFRESLGDEQADALIEVADLLARGADPADPASWYARVQSAFAEDPDAAGIDLATALLQEAGPRRSLSNQPFPFDESIVERYREYGTTVALADGREGLVTRHNPERQEALVDIVDDRGYETGEQVVVPYRDLRDRYELERGSYNAPVFYSQTQKILAEQLQPKMSPQQLRKALEKNGVKPAELEWTGVGDWIDALEESGIKSITREEVIQFLADPLNAFDLAETLWEQGHPQYRTRWGEGDYTGVALADVGGNYKELMIQLPGTQVYTSSGHMPNISNPIVQVRFHELPDQLTLVIDELQSDWGAQIRGNEYVVRSAEADRRRAMLEQRATKRLVDLAERVIEETGIRYDEIEGGTNHAMYIDRHVDELIRRLDMDFKNANNFQLSNVAPGPGHPDYEKWVEWMETPERKALERLRKHVKAVWRRIQTDQDNAGKIARAPADMPYKKTWQQLALKRMVAYAVQNGYQSIQWTQGIVPAVRYHKIEPGDYLSPTGEGGRYGTPSDHPQYPSEDDYSRSSTWFSHEFSEAHFHDDPLQGVLFPRPGEGLPTDSYPEPEPMSATRPWTITGEELGLDPDYPAAVDDLIHLDENHQGPFANQFVVVTRVNEDGTYDIRPSGILEVEIRGDGSDSGGGWTEYEVTVRTVADTPNGSTWVTGSGSTAGDALRSANFDDIADSEWFDDVETKLDQRWESELDDYLYQEAVDEFMERWNNGEIEGAEDYADVFEAEDIAQLDTSNVQEGNPYLYDSILPKEANKLWGKKYGIEVERGSIEAAFTAEGTGTVSTRGAVPTWKMYIPDEMADDVRQGQTFFQATYPITGGQPVIKGATELLGNDQFKMTLFRQADPTTAIHELGHIALYDLDDLDLQVIERDLAGSRSLKAGQWRRDDHERFARAWEKFFRTGLSSTTSLRATFGKLMRWMRDVYKQIRTQDVSISPDVQRVFERRLGRVNVDETDIARIHADPELNRWGVMTSQAKTELEAYERRVELAKQRGTIEATRNYIEQLDKEMRQAEADGDTDRFHRIAEQRNDLVRELEDRDTRNAMRGVRRTKLLGSRLAELQKALRATDSRRYEGAVASANWLQAEREHILRDVFGDKFDLVFAGRREQMARWLADHGHLPESAVGEGVGFMPFRRRQGIVRTAQRGVDRIASAPTNRKFGRQKTSDLNLHTRNQMILWQQGDYRADIGVLAEQYLRAAAFKYAHDMRAQLYDIGEGIDAETGPKEGWYIIDPEGTPLPREWSEGMTPDQVDAELQSVLDGLRADDEQLRVNIQRFVENSIHQNAPLARRADGSYGKARQVHPSIVHALILPYSGPRMMSPINRTFGVANTLARTALIYTSPGYIPSNMIANFIMLLADRGVMSFYDLYEGARLVLKDRKLGRLARAEMGETMTTTRLLNEPVPQAFLGKTEKRIQGTERRIANVVSFFADDWFRAAAWSGVARRHGYRGREGQLRLLNAREPKTKRDRELVATEAAAAMIDFNRMSPMEQRWIRPVVFVWPFLRGAAVWPVEYMKAHPIATGAFAAAAQPLAEGAEEQLGPVPDYYKSLVPIKGSNIANLQSVNPLGVYGDLAETALQATNVTEPISPFANLAGYLSPPLQSTIMALQGRGEFGEEKSTAELAKEELAPSSIPFLGLWMDIKDTDHPASQMEQGALVTLERKAFRFSPQQLNLAILNQQAKDRGETLTMSQKATQAKKDARAAWNQLRPGEHMDMRIERSIQDFYTVSEMRKMLQEEIKTKYRKSWQPTRRTPKLSPLQEAAIVYDVASARYPERMASLPDPQTIYDQYGEAGVEEYRKNISNMLFTGKNLADQAKRKAKQMKKAAA